jgi:hypothetical protein
MDTGLTPGNQYDLHLKSMDSSFAWVEEHDDADTGCFV